MTYVQCIMIEMYILLCESVLITLPFCTPVLIGPQVVPLPSFNRFSVGSEIKTQTQISSNHEINLGCLFV